MNSNIALDLNPTLQQILITKQYTLDDACNSLNEVSRWAFGYRNNMLTARERRTRRQIYRLGNLLKQLKCLDDVDVFAVGHRCPDQIERYTYCLKWAIRAACINGASKDVMRIAEDVCEKVGQVQMEVSLFYRGLS